jgi:hypothetical protein
LLRLSSFFFSFVLFMFVFAHWCIYDGGFKAPVKQF